MRSVLTCGTTLLFLLISAYSVSGLVAGAAAQDECSIILCKQAEGGDGILFPFTFILGELTGDFLIPANGDCSTGSLDTGQNIQVFEEELSGWRLSDVQCGAEGVVVTSLENGVDLDCVTSQSGGAFCIFFNVRGATNIPALSEWGMIAAAAGLGLVGVFFGVRRGKAEAV